MIQAVTSTHFPYLLVHLAIGPRDDPLFEVDIEVQVDTGFDGGVAVPRGLIPDSVPLDGHTSWQLADGTELRAPGYLCYVAIGQFPPVLTAAIALDGNALLGRHVIDRFRLILDHGSTLTVEP